MRGSQGLIVARLVLSVLDSLWLSWWMMALMLRWRRRSRAAAAALQWVFFNDYIVLVYLADLMGQPPVDTACSSTVHAEFLLHHRGARRQSGVEALLPRAAPIPKVQPNGFVLVAGTLGLVTRIILGGASVHDFYLHSEAVLWTLRSRAAGARPSDIVRSPRFQQWSRLAAWSLAEEYMMACSPAQAWASSQRFQDE